MGLPLFVAPVESDVHPKPPAKARRSASPPRSAIRRAPYVNVRDRAALSRRSRLLEMQERSRRPISRTLETALTTDTTSSGIAAAAEYIRNGFVTSDDLARPDMTERERWLEEREARRVAGLEALQRNREQRNREEGNREEDNNTHQDSRTQWWMVHPHAQSRRENVIMLGMERMRSRRRSRSPQVERTSALGRLTRRAGITLPSARELAASTRRRPTDDVNGLGDRNRSISPEGWDTLLSTLTPDPQPPSANSSFVSNAASQNPSTSFTSTSGQTLRLGTAPEPPCESGCENSDTEDGEAPPRRRHHVSRPGFRPAHPVRFDVPGLDYPLTGDDFATRGQPTQPDSLTPREGRSLRSDNGSINVYMARPTLLGSQRDGWVGSLSVGATEDSSGSEPPRPTGEGSFMSTGSTTSADEDLVSLQRIVRRLASRDDIPEEWWTETGLSRTLTRDRP
ncbi:unnamed protein product [Clonostachys rhizophaga]|uniref:Uncharacterized protein n=1 Tax=Clonostachys rhizophaga TaxID=160324 RepID=A0A9N9VA40_9HYPO|nr:unnamed protein product [Clonostachys rhizophaga]